MGEQQFRILLNDPAFAAVAKKKRLQSMEDCQDHSLPADLNNAIGPVFLYELTSASCF